MKTIYKLFFGILTTLILAMLVYAYSGNNPSIHGHSSGEIELPSNAVMAFDGACPSGWTELASSSGKT
ncbi:MAG: hypothetical protein IIB03_01135, partial [Acidobacteria bacterium]|nr:hypothetical protein [Acidobacteriota bacterium]